MRRMEICLLVLISVLWSAGAGMVLAEEMDPVGDFGGGQIPSQATEAGALEPALDVGSPEQEVTTRGMPTAAPTLPDTQRGLVAHYAFPGQAAGGQVVGAVLTPNRFGQPNAAYAFDGNDDYLNMGTPPWHQKGAWTWAAWVRQEASENQMILSHGTGWGGNGAYLSVYWEPGRKFKVLKVTVKQSQAADPAPFPIRTWQFVAATQQGTVLKLYRNGVLVGSNLRATPVAPPSQNFEIGRHVQHQQYWRGAIDDVRVYDRELTSAEIAALYAAEAKWPSLGHLPLRPDLGPVDRRPDTLKPDVGPVDQQQTRLPVTSAVSDTTIHPGSQEFLGILYKGNWEQRFAVSSSQAQARAGPPDNFVLVDFEPRILARTPNEPVLVWESQDREVMGVCLNRAGWVSECNGTSEQKWEFKNGLLINDQGQCLTNGGMGQNSQVQVVTCKGGLLPQLWSYSSKNSGAQLINQETKECLWVGYGTKSANRLFLGLKNCNQIGFRPAGSNMVPTREGWEFKKPMAEGRGWVKTASPHLHPRLACPPPHQRGPQGLKTLHIYGQPLQEFANTVNKLAREGYSLIDVDESVTWYPDEAKRVWSGVFVTCSDPMWFSADLTWEQFQAADKVRQSQNMHLVDIETYIGFKGERLWAGAWRGGLGESFLWVGTNWKYFLIKDEEFARTQNLQLLDIESYDGLYAGVWKRGSGSTLLIRRTNEAEFENSIRENEAAGLRLIDLEFSEETPGTDPQAVYLEIGLRVYTPTDRENPVGLTVETLDEVYFNLDGKITSKGKEVTIPQRRLGPTNDNVSYWNMPRYSHSGEWFMTLRKRNYIRDEFGVAQRSQREVMEQALDLFSTERYLTATRPEVKLAHGDHGTFRIIVMDQDIGNDDVIGAFTVNLVNQYGYIYPTVAYPGTSDGRVIRTEKTRNHLLKGEKTIAFHLSGSGSSYTCYVRIYAKDEFFNNPTVNLPDWDYDNRVSFDGGKTVTPLSATGPATYRQLEGGGTPNPKDNPPSPVIK